MCPKTFKLTYFTTGQTVKRSPSQSLVSVKVISRQTKALNSPGSWWFPGWSTPVWLRGMFWLIHWTVCSVLVLKINQVYLSSIIFCSSTHRQSTCVSLIMHCLLVIVSYILINMFKNILFYKDASRDGITNWPLHHTCFLTKFMKTRKLL